MCWHIGVADVLAHRQADVLKPMCSALPAESLITPFRMETMARAGVSAISAFPLTCKPMCVIVVHASGYTKDYVTYLTHIGSPMCAHAGARIT